MNYNLNHFKQAHQSIAYKDRIYNKLKENEVRDKILSERLSQEEYSNEDLYDFLKLLKIPRDK